MFRFGLVALAAVALLGSAAADISNEAISAYNAAAASPDAAVRIKAAKALSAEALANPDNEQSTLLAYEAAWMMCRSGDCKSAIAPAEFVAEQDNATAKQKLLSAFVAWKDSPKRKQRTSLDNALEAVAAEAPDSLTVSAFVERYVADMQSGQQAKASRTAKAAATHLTSVKEQVGEVWSAAAISAEAAAFNAYQKPDAMVAMAKIEAELKLMRHVKAEDPDWLKSAHYTASAWNTAMRAYFYSNKRYKAERELADNIVDMATEGEGHEHEASDAHSEAVPRCTGKITVPPKPKYPKTAQEKLYVGAVLVLFDLNEGGVTNPRIGAAVPRPIFNQAVLDAMEDVVWEWDETQEIEPCRKEDSDAIYPFEFVIR